VCIVYLLTIFTSAALLFLIQPMFARMVLPILGGAPAIWNAALVFYQAVLLGAYAYAHATSRWLSVRSQSVIHLSLMALAFLFLPVGIPGGYSPPSPESPLRWLMGLLLSAVGMPFFVVSATSPLLQRWFAATGHKHASDPYFLYAASNLGSMLALLAYPSVVEPLVALQEQGVWWSLLYRGLLVMMAVCAFWVWRPAYKAAEKTDAGPALEEQYPGGLKPGVSEASPAFSPRLRWVLLAFVPSSLMISVTTYMTTDIAAVPLLWVIPLSLYLLSFILVFARHPVLPHAWMVRAMPFAALPLAVVLAVRAPGPIAFVIPLNLAAFFVIAMVCHGELARSRPPARDLTRFYFYLSAGGVLGGAFNALLAPLIFKGIAEYPIVLTLAFFLLPRPSSEPRRPSTRVLDVVLPILLGVVTVVMARRVQAINPHPSLLTSSILFGLPALVSLSFLRRPLRFGLSLGAIFLAAQVYTDSQEKVLFAERSFFGVTRVVRDPLGQFNQFFHGGTLHGSQSIVPALRRRPLAYYSTSGPLGQFFDAYDKSGRIKAVGVVGLGSGAICCYGKPGQRWTYYEINPAVERIARDPRLFTYLQDCAAEVKVVLGDGRLSLKTEVDGAFDLLILDAYNSDAVPTHLLTREALQLYLCKIAPHGVLVFHISNRYLDLEPVLANLARDAGIVSLTQADAVTGGSEVGGARSKYLIMARDPADLAGVSSDPRWVPAKAKSDLGLWTDSCSSLLKILKWRG
jgi:hypothetical protein